MNEKRHFGTSVASLLVAVALTVLGALACGVAAWILFLLAATRLAEPLHIDSRDALTTWQGYSFLAGAAVGAWIGFLAASRISHSRRQGR